MKTTTIKIDEYLLSVRAEAKRMTFAIATPYGCTPVTARVAYAIAGHDGIKTLRAWLSDTPDHQPARWQQKSYHNASLDAPRDDWKPDPLSLGL